MAPRLTTIQAGITKAIAYLEKQKSKEALNLLVRLEKRIAGDGKATPKKPNAYAQFVAKRYHELKKMPAHKDKAAPEVMRVIAEEWKKQRATRA